MGHVVSLRNATVGDCSGTLVGPRFILTAAHCVVDAYVDSVTCAPQPIPAHPYTVIFDRQIVQDSDLPGTPPPVNRDSLGGSPAVVATSLVAVADGALDSVPNPTTMDFECRVVDVTRDMALLELAEPVDARGFARVRAGSIAENQLLPIIHHPGGDGPAVLAVGRVRDDGPAFADRIHVEEQALPLPAANDGVLAGGSSGSPIFDDEGYVVGVYSNASCGGVSACEEFSSVRIALPELGGFLNPAPHVARSGLGLFSRLPGGGFTGFSLPRTDFGVRNEQPLAVAVLDDGTSITAGFATSELGERIGALVAFDASGALMTSFQDNGRLADDIDLSSREEFVDIVIQAVGGEERILVLASVADPAEMMLVRYTSGGDRDTTFGVNGEVRISVPGVGADASTSAAALAVDPTDGSIVVAGHSSVRMLGRDYVFPRSVIEG